MKRFLTIASLVALSAILTPLVFAQPPGGPGGPGGGQGGQGQGGPGQAVLQALDTNSDQEISAKEIANAPTSLLKLDANGDGKLSSADQSGGQQGRGNRPNNQQQGGQGQGGPGGGHAGQGGPPSAQQFVTQAMGFDTNKDGKLDATELLAFAQKMGPPQGPPQR